ncbi:MAG: XTP/dITP diphosphatase [Candidatus Lokiarchaeota archaeon]|nr:XTP/dITP diphosphatase [Candidatus Lokiarchaeota archaeon]
MIKFATSNSGKFKEARNFLLKNYNIELYQIKDLHILEIQDNELENIAEFSLKELMKKYNQKMFVEDAGLFIKILKEFPGPYSSYVYKTIGNKGILQLLKPYNDPKDLSAYFKSVIAFYNPDKDNIKVFTGIVRGKIAKGIRGKKGWGFDPIFIPNDGDGRTFAEMGMKLKNKYSHRTRSLNKLGKYLQEFNIK